MCHDLAGLETANREKKALHQAMAVLGRDTGLILSGGKKLEETAERGIISIRPMGMASDVMRVSGGQLC